MEKRQHELKPGKTTDNRTDTQRLQKMEFSSTNFKITCFIVKEKRTRIEKLGRDLGTIKDIENLKNNQI